jgi:cysteine synthase B
MRCSLLAGFTDDGLLPVSIVQYPLRAWGRCPFAGNAVYVKATLHGYPRAACQPFQTMPVRHFLFFGILSAIAIKGPQVMKFQTLEATIGNTPLVRLQRLPGDTGNSVLVKLEGNNPAGSVKDRPALSMIRYAEARGEIRPGDTLIEATSGNTGIALAMVAATKGYRMLLVMPEHMSIERRAVMKAFGAEIILVSKEASMEGARMGTTGTIMGTSRYLKEQNPDIEIVGVTPAEGSAIPGIRRWPEAYLPTIFDASGVDRTIEVNQDDAEQTTLALAAREGIFAGISSGGAVAAALSLSAQVENAVIVAIICDRGDRYLSTGVFPD